MTAEELKYLGDKLQRSSNKSAPSFKSSNEPTGFAKLNEEKKWRRTAVLSIHLYKYGKMRGERKNLRDRDVSLSNTK